MRLRRYEIQPQVRERFIMCSLDCAQAAAQKAGGGGDAEDVLRLTQAAQNLLGMGEPHIQRVDVECLPEAEGEYRD